GAGDLRPQIATAEWTRRYDAALFERAVESADARVRRAAARAAGRIGDHGATGLLLRRLADPAGPVRRAAIFALGQLADPQAFVALRQALWTGDARDLPYLAEALGKIGDPRAAPDLAALLKRPGEPLRTAAALALFRLGDPSVLPEVFAALGRERRAGPREGMTYAAWRLLQKQRPATVPEVWGETLRTALQPPRPYAERIFGALALGALGGAETELLDLLDDEDPRVVVAAVRALQKPWSAAPAGRVRALMDHPDPLLREVALAHLAAGGKRARALLQGAGPAVEALPRLRLKWAVALAEAGQPDVAARTAEERWRVGTALGRIPDGVPRGLDAARAAAELAAAETFPRERALVLLRGLLRHEDWTVRSLAIKGLGTRGEAPGDVDRIVGAAGAARGTVEMDVRVQAADALAALGVSHPWLEGAAAADPDLAVRNAARRALQRLGRTLPPLTPVSFRLPGRDAAGVLRRARELAGARVRLETDRGPIEIVLHPDEAPAHCVGFAALVRKGYYDGLKWHRVVADFVIQGGCPRGDGWGGPGYALPDEIGTRPYVRGTVGMPKSVRDDGGCQIFITHLPTPHLDGRYTVYGQVVSGFDAVDRIRVGDRIVKATLLAAPEGG
ncbi:MAG: peptidylprolyl isomerase, partial [Planctomycetota bacterium]